MPKPETVVLSVRITRTTSDRLKNHAGNVSAWIAAVVDHALARGVIVSTSGAVIEPETGDLFEKKRRALQ